jgi:hypothetical protein
MLVQKIYKELSVSYISFAQAFLFGRKKMLLFLSEDEDTEIFWVVHPSVEG